MVKTSFFVRYGVRVAREQKNVGKAWLILTKARGADNE
jgi:hypothetical protein